MTDQEIEKLMEKLGSDYSVKRQNGSITVELVDIWEGVEFAECVTGVKVDRYGKEIIKGNIYPIYEWFKREVIYIDNDELGWQSKHFNPSTEAAYVEQLKAKAKELYGEIKGGDRFDRPFAYEGWMNPVRIDNTNRGFSYSKEHDQFSFKGTVIYEEGEWAKKIEEPIRVTVTSLKLDYPTSVLTFDVTANRKRVADTEGLANHIEEAIEAYLNKQ